MFWFTIRNNLELTFRIHRVLEIKTLFQVMAPKRKASTTAKSESNSKKAKSSSEKLSPSSSEGEESSRDDTKDHDFSCQLKSLKGDPWNLKVSSWNVNGIRAWIKKGGLSFIEKEQPDILCLQETKCTESQLPASMKNISGYHCYWLSGDAQGYSGVGLLSKTKPDKVSYGIGIKKHDNEGRCITAEYPHFFLVATYVPNSGRGLVRLQYRMEWDNDFREYLQGLDKKKPVILCGDLNVAHKEIDLKNPKTNTKTAGFTKEERENFTTLLEESGFIDSFRHLYPNRTGAYTFWTYMMNARTKNVGWRLDYFVLSKSLEKYLCDSTIRSHVMGSDHCPITLFMALKH